MTLITIKDLREYLTLLSLHREEDGEGGWQETWSQETRLWACVWPLISQKEKALYRVIIRSGITLPFTIGFLWSSRSLPTQSTMHKLEDESREISPNAPQLRLTAMPWQAEIARGALKWLIAITPPVLIQNKQFLCMITQEEKHA